VAEVLAPRLELLGGLANILAESDKSMSEAVRVEIRHVINTMPAEKAIADITASSPKSLTITTTRVTMLLSSIEQRLNQ
jgi:hypothetical protein